MWNIFKTIELIEPKYYIKDECKSKIKRFVISQMKEIMLLFGYFSFSSKMPFTAGKFESVK